MSTTAMHECRGDADDRHGASALPGDLLHAIFAWFVSPAHDMVVDGVSLRSCAAVNRQWRAVATSRSLWSIPTGIAALLNDRQCHESIVPAIQLSAEMQEIVPLKREDGSNGASTEDMNLSVDQTNAAATTIGSLMGFTKLETVQTAEGSTNDASMYRVEERATGNRCILSISATESSVHPMFLREINYEHFRLGGKCYLRPIVATDKPTGKEHCFVLRGISTYRGRLMWWHDDLAASGCDSTSTPLECQMHKYAVCDSAYEASVKKLRAFEETNLVSSRNFPPFFVEHRARIVDWIIEVVECLDADDQTPFQAMALFDQYLILSKEDINPNKYQLLASACIQIASKCSERPIHRSDLPRCADNSFDPAMLSWTELAVLKTLRWRIGFPTILDFVNAYCRELDCETPPYLIYVAELTLQSLAGVAYRASFAAACVVILGRYFQNVTPLWPPALEAASQFTWDHLHQSAKNLSLIIRDMELSLSFLRMIQRRNFKMERGMASATQIEAVESFDVPYGGMDEDMDEEDEWSR